MNFAFLAVTLCEGAERFTENEISFLCSSQGVWDTQVVTCTRPFSLPLVYDQPQSLAKADGDHL